MSQDQDSKLTRAEAERLAVLHQAERLETLQRIDFADWCRLVDLEREALAHKVDLVAIGKLHKQIKRLRKHSHAGK